MEGQAQGVPADERGGVRLDADTVVAAALAIVREEGARAVTMRRLGAQLGADPTAMYRHFRSKADLLAAMAERLFADAAAAYVPGPSWRANLHEILRSGRRIYRSHPGIAEALARHPDDSPGLARTEELILRELTRTGLGADDVARLQAAFTDIVAGTGLFHAVADDYSDPAVRAAMRRAYAALPPETHPTCVALAPRLFPDPEEVYEFTVELLLDAIEARARNGDGQGETSASEGRARGGISR